MISLREFVTKSGYSNNRYYIFEKRLKEFSDMFPDKVLYTMDDITAYSGENKSVQEQMNVIAKYLKMNLKLIEASKEVQTSISIAQAITMYMADLNRRNYAQESLRRYLYYLGLFNQYLEGFNITLVQQITKQVLSSFKQYIFMKTTIHGKRYEMSTQKAVLLTVKSWCTYLLKEGCIAVNPARKLTFPREEKKLSRNYLTQQEMYTFLQSIDTNTVYGFFDRTLFETLYSTGLRKDELSSLACNDVKLDDNLLIVYDGKGKQDRVCVLTATAKKYIALYLENVRIKHLHKDITTDLLFPSVEGNTLEAHYFTKRIRRYSQIAGITHTISAHAFRHSFATHLLEQGVDIRYIQKLLGHKRIDTTMKYIRVTVKDLRGVLVNCHPREKEMQKKAIRFAGVRRYEYERK